MHWIIEPDLKKIESVVEVARNGIRRNSGVAGNWLILGRALINLGRFEQAVASLQQAVSALPSSGELQILLAEALMALGRFEEALSHSQAVLQIEPGDKRAGSLSLNLRALLGHWDRDEEEPQQSFHWRWFGRQVRLLDPARRVDLCDSYLAQDPGNTNAKYWKAVALSVLGRGEEATRFMGIDRLLEIQQPDVPAGYTDGGSFRDVLAQEILNNPTLAADPRGRTTRNGYQTRSLRQPDAVATDALLKQIRRAVDLYEERLASSGDEFLAGRPRRARLQAWAVMHGSSGRQKAHRHPDGWLSGVYYVTAPRVNGKGRFRGSLLVGALDPEEEPGTDTPWGVHAIEPVPGRLVLFPSYVPHATEPSGVDGHRICVAFDVVPHTEVAAP